MNDVDATVRELRLQAAQGKDVAQIATWLRDELGEGATFFSFANCLFLAFQIPVGAISRAQEWQGFGWGGSLSDEELNQLLAPLVPRLVPPGETSTGGLPPDRRTGRSNDLDE